MSSFVNEMGHEHHSVDTTTTNNTESEVQSNNVNSIDTVESLNNHVQNQTISSSFGDEIHKDKVSNWDEPFLREIITNKGFTLVLQLLQDKELHLKYETPASAASLGEEKGLFSSTKYMTVDLEKMIYESFCEDNDEALHLLTIRENNNPDFAVGAIFWRDMENEEMKDWITVSSLHTEAAKLITNKTYKGWDHVHQKLISHVEDNPEKALFEDWIKIELIVTHQDYCGQRIGTILLALALLHASKDRLSNSTHCAEHVLLHAAGGQANIPAVRLYHRLGFDEAPDGMFHKPCRNMFILPHILDTLKQIDWQETLHKKSKSSVNTASQDTNLAN